MNSKATILVVDDEPDVREVLEEYFAAPGDTVICADGAGAAKAVAAAIYERNIETLRRLGHAPWRRLCVPDPG